MGYHIFVILQINGGKGFLLLFPLPLHLIKTEGIRPDNDCPCFGRGLFWICKHTNFS